MRYFCLFNLFHCIGYEIKEKDTCVHCTHKLVSTA